MYDALYLSPHLDDAAFSCGGQIHRLAQSGQKVLVVTLMTADAPDQLSSVAEELHRIWNLADVMASRRQEDLAACQVLGVEALHGGIHDALYRSTEGNGLFYTRLGMLFGRPHPIDEAQLLPRLTQYFAALPQADRIFAPLGAGRHVDHLLVRRAAERAFGVERVEYYEDFPYARNRWVLLKALMTTLGPPWHWHVRVCPLDDVALAAKCRAIACYASQITTAFQDMQDMEHQVRDFSSRRGGERVWTSA